MTAVRVRGAIRRDETIVRLGGNGDNWHMSWSGDGQSVSLCDGFGWTRVPQRLHNTRLYRTVGHPPRVRFADVRGYPDLADDPLAQSDQPRYYGFGTLAVDGLRLPVPEHVRQAGESIRRSPALPPVHGVEADLVSRRRQ
jgi:hypothetical protein